MRILMKKKKPYSLLIKAKKMPVGTVSKGRKKIKEGLWVPVKENEKKLGVGDTVEFKDQLSGKTFSGKIDKIDTHKNITQAYFKDSKGESHIVNVKFLKKKEEKKPVVKKEGKNLSEAIKYYQNFNPAFVGRAEIESKHWSENTKNLFIKMSSLFRQANNTKNEKQKNDLQKKEEKIMKQWQISREKDLKIKLKE